MITDSEKRAVFYEQKADEARTKADAITDFEARQTMLQVAAMWDVMARRAKGRGSG
jgi:hypothetical protein